MNEFSSVLRLVSRLKAGEHVVISQHLLREPGGVLGAFLANGFTPPDRILENIIGSSVTHRYWRTHDGDYEFQRLHGELPEGVRSYVSPDRRGWFTERSDGLYQYRESEVACADEPRIRCAIAGHLWGEAWVLPESLPMAAFPEISPDATVQLVKGSRCQRCGAPEANKPQTLTESEA